MLVLLLALLLLGSGLRTAAAQTLDTLVFGTPDSESAHNLTVGWGPYAPASVVDGANGIPPSDPSLTPPSDVVVGGLGQTARRLLPRTPNPDIYGGQTSFRMAVDPIRQNYLTLKLWGSDTSSGIWLVLVVDGLELGLRHGGDSAAPNMLFGNKQTVSFAPQQWVYRTVALPLHLTRGKTSVDLTIRSMGWISDYDSGPLFGAYNKLMSSPSFSLYRLSTHLGSRLDTSGEHQGAGIALKTPRAVENETTVLAGIRSGINSQLAAYLGSAFSSLEPWDLAWLARCYDARERLGESWISYGSGNTAATLVQKVIDGIDYHVARQAASSSYQASFGNASWGGGFGGLGEAIQLLWTPLSAGTALSGTVAYGGSYGTLTRTAAWSRALRTSVDHGRFNRRGGTYANQDIYAVIDLYNANRGLLLVDSANALLETEAQRYLREAAGLLPWAGSDQAGGGPIPVKGTYPFGTSFYSITSKGTTRDGNGFVGSDYGEMGQYVYAFGTASGAEDLKQRGLQLLRARAYFRFPAADDAGYRVLQAANPIGVRNMTLPGHTGYLARGDGAPEVAALGAAVIGADLLGYFQNAVNDGQAVRMISGSRDPYLPRNWTLARAQAATGVLVPMSPGAPDVAWADEENMVVAAKHGESRLFANLNWAAPGYIGGWAKIFHLPDGAAPEIAEVQLDDLRYRPTGTRVTLGARVDADNYRQPFDNPINAYRGQTFPQGFRSDLSSVPANNADAGKGTGYTLRYGNWLIGLNAHHSDSYEVLLPSNFASALPLTDLISGSTVTSTTVTLAPKTSVVFYLPDVVDPAPRPQRPLQLTARSTATTIVLDWSTTAGAATYEVRRSTTAGSGAVVIGTTGATTFVDTTASAGTTYYYAVAGRSSGGLAGGASPEVSASLQATGLRNRASGGLASASPVAASYPASLAFDGSNATKWNSGETGVGATLAYDFGASITWAVTSYSLTSADTTLRDPRDWTFEGSHDGVTWVVLDTRSGETFASRAQTKSYTVTNTVGFRHYRLAVTASSGGLGYEVQLAELALLASAPGSVPTAPAPATLTATSGSSSVFLTWPAVATATSYRVERALAGSGSYSEIGTTSSTFFLDTSAPASGLYDYQVRSLNPGGSGPASPVASAYFGPQTPAAPATLTAENGPTAGAITLRWGVAPGVPTYTVKRSSTSGSGYVTIASGLSDPNYIDTGRPNGSPCYYIVTATSAGLESAPSPEAVITPLSFAWNGASSSWSVATNWTGGVPTNGALLLFGGTPTITSTSNFLSGLTIGGLVFGADAAAFTLAGNSLVLGGNIVSYAATNQTVSLGLTLSGSRTFEINSGQLLVSGVLSDGSASYGLTKTGTGTLVLSAANSFDGGLSIEAGTVQIGTSTGSGASGSVTSLGASGSRVSIGPATLRFQMGSNSANTLPQSFVLNSGALITSNDGKVTLGGSSNTITVNGSALLQSRWSGKWLVFGGLVSGSGTLSVNNANSGQSSAVAFTNGANTFQGTVTVEETTSGYAAAAISHNDALRFARVELLNTVSGNSGLWFTTTAPVLGSLAGVAGSQIQLNSAGLLYGAGPSLANSAVQLSVGYDNSDCQYDGALTGSGGLGKIGSGTLTLTGALSHTGETVVAAGTLLLRAPLTGGGNTSVVGGTLAGDTVLAGPLTIGSAGTLTPGEATDTGTLTATALTLLPGATLDFKLRTPGTSDRVVVSGGGYTPPSGGTANLRIYPGTGFGPRLYTLIEGVPGVAASQFTVLSAPPANYTYSLQVNGATLQLLVSGPPAPPTLVRAAASSGTVTLAWEASPGATSYAVYIATSTQGPYTLVGTTTGTSYTLTGLTNGTAVYGSIVPINALGSGAASEPVSATPNPYTWSASPTSLDWSLASNWGGTVPVDAALLTFGSSTATNLNNDLEGLSLGGLLFRSGASAFTLSGTPVILAGDITNSSTALQTLNLQMTLLGNRTLTTATGALTLKGALDDGGLGYGVIKAGTGTLTLSGANTFSGGITLNAGTLLLSGSGAAGAGGPLLLNGGTLRLSGANLTGAVTVPTGATVSLVKEGGVQSTLRGTLSGGGTLNESGNSNGLHFYSDNSGFTGVITSANSGSSSRWRFNVPEAGSAAAQWSLNCTATDAYGFAFGADSVISFGALTGSGSLRNNGAGQAIVRVGDLGLSGTFSGSTTFNIALLKVGAGSWTLASGSLGHYGDTTVSAGTLNVTGTIVSSRVVVQSGATLSGTGALGGVVRLEAGSTLSPGSGGTGAAGTLTVNGTFAPVAGSALLFELGSTSDLLLLGTTSSYTAPSGVVTLNLAARAGFGAGSYTLLTNTGTGAPAASHFTLGTVPSGYRYALSQVGTSLLVTVTALTALESWRQQNFGLPDSSGTAADSADPDGDGLPNLLEYALDGAPLQGLATDPAQPGIAADRLTLSFRRRADPTLVYEVWGGATPGSWGTAALWSSTGASNTAGTVTVTDTVAFTGTRRFLQLRVRLAP